MQSVVAISLTYAQDATFVSVVIDVEEFDCRAASRRSRDDVIQSEADELPAFVRMAILAARLSPLLNESPRNG